MPFIKSSACKDRKSIYSKRTQTSTHDRSLTEFVPTEKAHLLDKMTCESFNQSNEVKIIPPLPAFLKHNQLDLANVNLHQLLSLPFEGQGGGRAGSCSEITG